MKSTIAMTTAVEVSIAQLLSVLSFVVRMQAAVLALWIERETELLGTPGSNGVR
jgi:hypothetical protein